MAHMHMDDIALNSPLMAINAQAQKDPAASGQRFSILFPRNVCPKTFLLFVVYGVGAWVTINGVFSELPLIVNDLPESWSAASYITLIIQMANVGPILYLLLQRHVSLHQANVAVLLCGALSMCFLAFFWNQTSSLSGSTHSEAMFILVFFAALADCTTSVVYWPFAALFHHDYVAAITAGEGLSGLLASVASWIQNAPSSGLLFSPTIFFLIMAGLLCASLGAFWLLDRIPADAPQRRKDVNAASEGLAVKVVDTPADDPDHDQAAVPLLITPRAVPTLDSLGWGDVLPHLGVVAWISFCQNGMKPSIMSYATLPYGQAAYHWATNVALTLDPAFAAVCLLIEVSTGTLWLLTLVWTGCMAFLLAIALCSPTPPAGCGPFLVVFVASLASGLMAFTKCICARFIQRLHAQHSTRSTPLLQLLSRGRSSLRNLCVDGALPTLLGLFVQLGSLVGAILFFVLVNHTTMFHE